MKEHEAADCVLIAGKPNYEKCDNKVKSARYTMLNFFPKVRLFFLFDCFRMEVK
jgi:hypothetical protein